MNNGKGSLPVPIEELRKDIQAYIDAGGNKSEAARMRKMKRNTFRDRLDMAQTKLRMKLGKIVDGHIDYVEAVQRPLPPKGGVARYFLSSCQNNTYPHPGLANVRAYGDWFATQPKSSFEMIFGSFSYAIDAYGVKAVKRGSYDESKKGEKLWFAPELVPHIKDESIQLAPGLIWCGEMNILPTATSPLTGLDDYNGRSSNIIPHAKHAMESIASLADEATKFNYATGAITMRNYIKKRAGIVAERKHSFGGVLVEVDCEGNWYVRQLQIGDDGAVYDIGPRGYRGVRIADGKVDAIPLPKDLNAPGRSFIEAVTWGDIHASEMELWVRELGWGPRGMLNQLRPRKQFWHDLFSMRAAGHHEIKDFHRTFEKHVNGESSVDDEIQVTADFATEAYREWCESVVIRSNHDRHLNRWLNEANPAHDMTNARYFYRLQDKLLDAIEGGDKDFNVLEWALRNCANPIPAGVKFNGEDESYIILKKHGGGIECGLHGDLGPNGARGSTRSLRKLGRRVNKAHDHKATWYDGVLSGGACARSFSYSKGPNAASISHILTYENASRTILTFWNEKFRA